MCQFTPQTVRAHCMRVLHFLLPVSPSRLPCLILTSCHRPSIAIHILSLPYTSLPRLSPLSRLRSKHMGYSFEVALTFPITLYRLLKNVYHSSSTVLCLSSRSSHSGMQSSAFRLDVASAREGSLPANTVEREQTSSRQSL